MKRYIEGEERSQVTLLPECLDDYIAQDNTVRVVDVFVDELDLTALGFDGMTPAITGRPSYHPSVLLKLYIYGYLNRIQSSRRLERECQRNVELMWLALGSGVFEELVYRGVLFRIVEESLGSWISLLVSSLVFGVAHLHNENATVVGALSISVEAGLLLAGAYMMTRRLWMSIGFHFAWNFTQSGIFSGNVSGIDTGSGLIKASVQGSELLTGGSFGLEASLVALLLGTTTGVVLLLLAVRRGNVMPPFWFDVK